MKCAYVKIGNTTAIVCGRGNTKKKCVVCGRAASRLCDWKMGKKNAVTTDGGIARMNATCYKPLCDVCAFPPAHKKDLCPEHAKAFKVWRAAQASKPLELKP